MQLKTIYNLNCKYKSDFLASDRVIEFDEIRQVAVSKEKLIIKGNQLIFPSVNVVTQNVSRSNLAQQLDALANAGPGGKKIDKKYLQFLKDKACRVALDRQKLSVAAFKFPVGYNQKQVDEVLKTQNPALVCGFYCHWKEEVELADIHVKGYAPFK